ncbi:hypothetical protein [Campylobacter pinnipediorum]|uniref:hypothetical protein n=1 Tax=Campylobacter pinnipediorum TaxID=1965231 RepID=UPI00084DDD68|nr:hypothetical protein [Campylobacter pinnipediorum]
MHNSTIYGTVKNIIITKQGFKIGILQALGKTSKSRYCINDIFVDDVMPEIQKNAKKLREQGVDIVLLMASSSLLDEVNQMLDKGIVDLAFSKNEHIVNKKYITKEKNIFLFKPDEIAVVDIKKDNNKIKITSKKTLY